ncbi:MAG: AAA family ATPase, partial [Solirubrobacteraceae bacterium]
MTVEPQHLPGAGTEREVLRFLDVPGMVAVPPPPVEWLARPLIARGSLTVLYAPGGDGKSLLAGALAGAIAEGTEVAGIECQKGTAIYLDAENGEHEIHRRVHTLGLPGEGVAVADASSFDLRRDLDVLAGVLRERQPDLAVLDSFRSLTPGLDENDTKQTAAAIDPLRRLAHETGVAVLLIHHSNKAGRDFRGASSIRDACDVLWHLGRADDDDDQRRRFLACRKMRIAAEPERMWLSLEVDRGRVLIDQAEPADAGEAKTVQPVRAVLSDRILAEMDGNVMKLAEVAEMVGRKPKDGSVRNALAALVAEGLLVRDTTGYSKVQTVQTEAFAPLHPAPEAVQSAKALKGDCT